MKGGIETGKSEKKKGKGYNKPTTRNFKFSCWNIYE
jgi:hypothetical protein